MDFAETVKKYLPDMYAISQKKRKSGDMFASDEHDTIINLPYDPELPDDFRIQIWESHEEAFIDHAKPTIDVTIPADEIHSAKDILHEICFQLCFIIHHYDVILDELEEE